MTGKSVRLLALCAGVSAFPIAVYSQPVGGGPVGPSPAPAIKATINSGGQWKNQANTYQANANIVTPYNYPYNVIPNPSSSAGVQSTATRLRNRQGLNQWQHDIGDTVPGAMQALGDFNIEVCLTPEGVLQTNQNAGSVDFRNTSALAGAKFLGVRGGAKLIAYNCNNGAWVVQAPIAFIGGRQQDIVLAVTDGVSPTTDPVVSHFNATFASGVMTASAPLNNAGGAVSANANGSLKVGQNMVRSPGTGSTLPVNCYISSQLSGNTSLDGTYQLDGGPLSSPHSCQSYTNTVSQVIYGGQAAEVANNGAEGNIGFAAFCPTQSKYDLFATVVATGRTLPPVNAGPYGSCGSGNNSFSNEWFIRADTVKYRFSDMQGYNAGSSGDISSSEYYGNGGADLNLCGVENKYYGVTGIKNCESSNVAKVESADYLNPNTANNGGQTNISPVAIWYTVGGNTQDATTTWHFESNIYNCTGGFGSDNGGLIYQGSGTSVIATNLQAISTTLSGCTHFAYHRLFGTDVHVHDLVIQDGGTSGGSGSWVLNGAVLAIATSNNSALTRGVVQVDQLQIQNSPGAITLASYNLATNDAPVMRFTSLPTVNVYNTNGSFTWTNPTIGGLIANTNASVLTCGAGGGAGSGAQETLGTVGSGGAGGGGGSCNRKDYSTSELGTSQTMTVGAGGAGGLATSGTGPGNDGAGGNNTTFGALQIGYGGGRGGGGQTAANSGGGGGAGCGAGGNATGSTAGTAGACGGGAGTAGNAGISAPGYMSGSGGGGSSVTVAAAGGGSFYCPGGSSGGTLLAATASNGVAGNSPVGASVGGTAGSSAGGNASQVTASQTGGAGGSGAANTAGAGFAPGTSANCAGGSGSGAGTANGVAGGQGGSGLGVVRTW